MAGDLEKLKDWIGQKEAGVDDLVLLQAGADVPLGECLNRLVAASDGDVVAKMDDDDLYGAHYLSDQLDALAYSGADVVGKQAHYLYVASLDATMLRFAEREHRYTDFVMGPTIVAHSTPEMFGFGVRRAGRYGRRASTVSAWMVTSVSYLPSTTTFVTRWPFEYFSATAWLLRGTIAPARTSTRFDLNEKRCEAATFAAASRSAICFASSGSVRVRPRSSAVGVSFGPGLPYLKLPAT